ncbi:uncharacterized protein LOC144919010 [Branchiostoma floridae x Branchiostoma belcheri]
MRLTVTAVLCVLTVSYLYGPDRSSALLARRRRYVDTRRRVATIRRTSGSSGGGSSYCLQQYKCTAKYRVNDTLYSTDDAYLPVEASKVNLCSKGETWDSCTSYKNCRTRFLANGRTLTTNLDDWTATHWGNVTTQPKPVSVILCDSAPGGMTQKGTVLILVASVTMGLITGLCFLPR